MTFGQILTATAARTPEKVALSCGDDVLTFADFDRKTTGLALGMQRAGVRKGDRVALHMGNTLEMALCYFACFKLGAIAVPLNIRLKRAEVEYVLGHSETSLYIGEPGLYERTAATPVSCPSSRFYQTTADTPATGFAPFAALLGASDEAALPEVRDIDAAVILYTSGTTARPKGVTHSHDSLLQCVKTSLTFGYRGEDVFLLYASLAHASGLALVLLPSVLLGAESALVRRFDPRAVLQTLERRRCSATFGLPATLQALCREQASNPCCVDSMRLCGAGGDTVSAALQSEFRARFGVDIQELIGMTEGVPLCLNKPGRIRVGSVGEAADGVDLRIVDENGETVEPGMTGELIARAPLTMIGYWNEPEATASTVRDGWLYTGDRARRDEDGYYWFAGRKKEIIIRGGSNVSPQEVEEVLLTHPAVFQAGVVGIPDPEFGESVIAFVSLRDNGECSEPELIAFARQFLSDHKVPAKVHFLAELPLGTTGKVSRKTLKESLQAQPAVV